MADSDFQEHVLAAIDRQKRTAIRIRKGAGIIPLAWVEEAIRLWHDTEVHGQDDRAC